MAKEAAKGDRREQKAVNEKLEAIEKANGRRVLKQKRTLQPLNKNIAEMQARVKAISQTEKSNGKTKSFNQPPCRGN